MAAVTLGQIVAALGGELHGAPDQPIHQLATLECAGEGDITFLSNPKYRSQLTSTRASAVIVAPGVEGDCPTAHIVTAQPYVYFARLSQWMSSGTAPSPGVHPTAVVETDHVPASVSIGPGAWVSSGVRLGERVVVGAGCAIGPDAEIGEGSTLMANVTVYGRCSLGRRVLVHAGAVIGADGFGFARESDGSWIKIIQSGRVLIGDDVEIGANTTIDRGALEDTVIENGVKLDNQIQIGHNVRIGAHTAMAGCVGVAGSARIGRRCTVGGGAIILGHLELADDVHVSAGTLVAKSISQAGSYTGTVPFMPHDAWLRNFSRLRHLESLADKISFLEKRLADLEKKL